MKIENILNPVTALAYVELGRLYLISGEGQYLSIFDHDVADNSSKALIQTIHVFSSQPIQGIAASKPKSSPETFIVQLLVWGGRTIRVLNLSLQPNGISEGELKADFLISETHAHDQILDGCFRPHLSNKVVLVTANNELLSLDLSLKKDLDPANLKLDEGSKSTANCIIKSICSGPRSTLYSAHVVISGHEKILVAAGTVLGDVLLWSISQYYVHCSTTTSCLHYTCMGHDGSIFGVKIIEGVQLGGGSVYRILASCSDDRTIRIWDISDLTAPKGKAICLAKAVGHASRIWGVLLLSSNYDHVSLLSYGEDSTSQIWQLCSSGAAFKGDLQFILSHQTTCAYHRGKNIWTAAIQNISNESGLISTGGADGRIVSYRPFLRTQLSENIPVFPKSKDNFLKYMSRPRASNPLLNNSPLSHEIQFSQCTMDQAVASSRLNTDIKQAHLSPRSLFAALKGPWKLSRTLRSAIASCPSGSLHGSAEFQTRQVTDKAYDAEHLYSEEGDYTTEQGLTMKATRLYAYRYQESTTEISVWFVNSDNAAVDYVFHVLEIQPIAYEIHDNGETRQRLTAQSHHLCVNDKYNTEYYFTFSNSQLEEISIVHTVKGPEKDYVADARYSREPSREGQGATSDQHLNLEMKGPNSDAFKTYAWVSDQEFLATTEQGTVLLGTLNARCEQDEKNKTKPDYLPQVTWKEIGHEGTLGPSCVASSCPEHGVAFLSGRGGNIYFYQHENRSLVSAYTMLAGKVAYLTAGTLPRIWNEGSAIDRLDTIGLLITCVDSAIANLLVFGSFDTKGAPKAQWKLPLPSQFIVTSSCFLTSQKLLILGSRNGNLCIYYFSQVTSHIGDAKCHEFIDIHGQDAVTVVQVLPGDAGRLYILTAGRDGKFAVHRLSLSRQISEEFQVDLQTVHTCVPTFGPNIEGACFDRSTGYLYLWGFRSTQFVVWDASRNKEVMNVECGGAHRNWSYFPLLNGMGGGSFVWTKSSICNIYSQGQSTHRILQAGGHGREIKAMAISPEIKTDEGIKKRLIATGAEDTNIGIFEPGGERGLQRVTTLTKHITGIQGLTWSEDGRYLFSAAGCEEFFVWRVRPVPCIGIGVVCEAQCQRVTASSDLRILGFSVADLSIDTRMYLISMAYSDSSIRIFKFNPASVGQSLQLVLQGSYNTFCLTQSTFIRFGYNDHLCTASGDGNLQLWSSTDLPEERALVNRENVHQIAENGHERDARPYQIECYERIPVHQSSIKTMLDLSVFHQEHLVVTGGDDQSLAFTRIHPSSSVERIQGYGTLVVPNAHASSITALAYLGRTIPRMGQQAMYLSSVGNDQRLKTWLITVYPARKGVEGLHVKQVSNVYSSIADAAALEVFHDVIGHAKLYVAGVGIESWLVDDLRLRKE